MAFDTAARRRKPGKRSARGRGRVS